MNSFKMAARRRQVREQLQNVYARWQHKTQEVVPAPKEKLRDSESIMM